MKQKLLNFIACPKCCGQLEYNQEQQTLFCAKDMLVYSIIDGIAVLIEDDAKKVELSDTKVSL